MKKDKSLIPIGQYCYRIDTLYDGPKIEDGGIPTVNCPYQKYKKYKNTGVSLPYCAYLEEYGWSNNMTNEEFDKLVEHFGSEDKTFDAFPMDLLWDSCKECGENHEEDFINGERNDENVKKINDLSEKWIIKIKKLNNG